ncbi:histidine kinase dimerization/phospho-acceptor domain-containing protein [Micromonospora sp. M12]
MVTFRDITDQQRRDHDRELFVAVTSHELRTPVTVIKGYADTLTDHWESLTDVDRRQAARVIGQRANELARLVDRLLSSAAEVGPGTNHPPRSTSARRCAPQSSTCRRSCVADWRSSSRTTCRRRSATDPAWPPCSPS